MSNKLWVVATPIGNLNDLTPRATTVLSQVDLILAEDTRHSGKLLAHLGLKKPMRSCHEHNERDRIEEVISRLEAGEDIAIISDAGTPLISDPGYRLVAAVRHAGFDVMAAPGVSSVITALSISGLPTDNFCFHGFLPHKSSAKAAVLRALEKSGGTAVFFESVHRIRETAKLIDELFSREARIFVARELTKQFEETGLVDAGDLLAWLEADNNRLRGEYVLVFHVPLSAQEEQPGVDVDALIKALQAEGVSTKSIATALSTTLGLKKKVVYQRALSLEE